MIIQEGPQRAVHICRVTLLSQVKCRAERHEKDKDREINFMTQKTLRLFYGLSQYLTCWVQLVFITCLQVEPSSHKR